MNTASTTAKLKAVDGPSGGEIFDIPSDGAVLGRVVGCEIHLHGDNVSRRHAKLSWLGDKLTIEDAGSTNGVYVNGDKINGRVQLYTDDRIRICDNKFVVVGGTPFVDTHRRTRQLVLLGVFVLLTILVIGAAWYQTRRTSAPAGYTVKIRSLPDNAQVYNGGKLIGKTPLEVPHIASGEYRIVLRHPGHRDLETVIKVPQGEAVRVYELPPISEDDPEVLKVTTLPAGGQVYIDEMYRGRTERGSSRSPESPPLLVPGLKVSEPHVGYFTIKGKKSKVYEFHLQDGPLRMMIWQPDMIITTRHGRRFLGMIRRRKENGDLLVAIGPDRDVWFKDFEIVEVTKVFPVRMRGNEGVEILGDPKSKSPVLLVDPFPNAQSD